MKKIVLQFENKTNSSLYMEKSTNLSVIVGNYDNSKEMYDNELPIDSFTYKIEPRDGKKFVVTTPQGTMELGKVIKGIQLLIQDEVGTPVEKDYTKDCRILRFENTGIVQMLEPGAKIFSKSLAQMCTDYTVNDYIFTVADPTLPENKALLDQCQYILKENEVMLKTDLLWDVFNKTLYYTNPIDFPNWIYEGIPLLFTKITDKMNFENKDEFGDIEPIPLEYKEEYVGIVDSVSYNPLESYFTVDIDTTINSPKDKFRISCNSKQNHGNIIEQNTIGGTVSVGLTAINNGEFVRCTDFKCSDGGLLLYDQLYEKKVGTVSGSLGSKKLIGFNTNFLQDFKPDSLMMVEGYETPLKIKKVLSNVNIELYEPLEFSIDELDIYLTDSIYNSVESIIYDIYDNRDNDSQGNFHNIMPIRGNRKIKFFFGAKEKNIRNVTGNIFETDINPDLYNVYKLWVNGKLLERGKQYIFNNDKTIKILEDSIIKKYNNYCYFIYYPKNYNNTNNYAFLAYEGYKTNFPSKKEYVDSLYKFPYYSNFSESPSYNYYEFRDEILDTPKRILLDKTHTLSFSSYITNDAGEINNKNITIDLENITRNTYGFRLIRHNRDTNTFVVYNECELVNPASETINDDANIVTYTINHKDKIILLDRSFGDGDWGRFELFGLKLLGIY